MAGANAQMSKLVSICWGVAPLWPSQCGIGICDHYFQPNLELGLTSLFLAMRTISRPLWETLRGKTGLEQRLISCCKSQCFACIDVTHGELSIAAPTLYSQKRLF